MTTDTDNTATLTLIRGMEALYRAAVLDVMMNRYRWSAEAADRVAGEVTETVRRRAARDRRAAAPPPAGTAG